MDEPGDLTGAPGDKPSGDPPITADEFGGLFREDPPDQAPAAPPTVGVDTGRLFKSSGTEGHDEAVPALTASQSGKLRTLDRSSADRTATERPAEAPAPVGEEPSAPATAADIPVISVASAQEAPVPSTPAFEDVPRRPSGRRGLRAVAVYIVVVGVTVLVGFANALINNGSLNAITGVALLVASTYAALTVRRSDDAHAVIAPPLAFAAAALTAGQLFVGASVQSVLDRAVVFFFTLADNWMWIIGSTLIALVVVVVRRMRRS